MRILLIDDNSTIGKLVETLIKKHEYLDKTDEIIFKKSANFEDEELKLLLNQCDLIICDFDLGSESINGIEFFNLIEGKTVNKPKFLLTGNDTDILQAVIEMKEEIVYIFKNTLSAKDDGGIHKIGAAIKELKQTLINKE